MKNKAKISDKVSRREQVVRAIEHLQEKGQKSFNQRDINALLKTPIHKSTMWSILDKLIKSDDLERDEDGSYILGKRLDGIPNFITKGLDPIRKEMLAQYLPLLRLPVTVQELSDILGVKPDEASVRLTFLEKRGLVVRKSMNAPRRQTFFYSKYDPETWEENDEAKAEIKRISRRIKAERDRRKEDLVLCRMPWEGWTTETALLNGCISREMMKTKIRNFVRQGLIEARIVTSRLGQEKVILSLTEKGRNKDVPASYVRLPAMSISDLYGEDVGSLISTVEKKGSMPRYMFKRSLSKLRNVEEVLTRSLNNNLLEEVSPNRFAVSSDDPVYKATREAELAS